MTVTEWEDSDRVEHYLALVNAVPRVAEGESVLLDQVPLFASRLLDLGTGVGDSSPYCA